ncbi:hypothetical protein J2S40_000055 [Nocardioides luteus]|uniref:Ig-like domain-containing protein n=1 Tax=Nocardioides luteus TaxID=1844 RepID=A0ABQ5T4N8_9ACTN|nr:hypothetical protein [Nocardioides luteus]MDR7308997.1 hypothetical protein [Nocardioides luteus]GGR71281.1 hypothetical protein GCM10010197_43380 [Nocardioides luteus]GLJ70697.1 hypothetical protein GCM10017579_47330 [Nocardioides luteus]
MSDPTGSTAQQRPKPTELANAAAEEARRRRLGLPPLPRRRRDRGRPIRLAFRWLVIVGVLVGMAFLGTSAWAYFTGEIGPLRGDEKAVARTLTFTGDTPSWADPEQIRCAAEAVVKEKGSAGLVQAGVVARAGRGFSYTGEWPSALGAQWYDALLGCADGGSRSWSRQVASAWTLHDPRCLRELGRPAIAGVLAVTDLKLTDEELAAKNVAAITGLDSCYARTPEAPTGTATAGYREVTLKVSAPAVASGIASIDDGAAQPTTEEDPDLTYTLPVAKGGTEACVQATTKVTYAWGTVRTGEPTAVCGKASAPTLEWHPVKRSCPKDTPKCTYMSAYVEGLADKQKLTITYRPTGDFKCAGKKKTCTVKIEADANGKARTPGLMVTGKKGKIVASAGALKATYPAS